MGWNDTFTAATDWTAISHIEMFWLAMNERKTALGQSTNHVPIAGADVQYAGTGQPGSTTGSFSVRYIQDWITTNCSSFSDASITLPHAGTSDAWTDGYTTATLYAAAGINASGFTRKYPREFIGNGKVHRVDLSGGADPTGGTWVLNILGASLTGLAWNIAAATLQTAIRAILVTGASTVTVIKSGFQYTITYPEKAGDVTTPTVDDSGLTNAGTQTTTITTVTNWNATATVYTDGSAFSNGHRARSTTSGYVYDRTGGAWVVTSNPTGAAPDVITAYGKQVAGDYIGPWLWNELRDAIKLLKRVCHDLSMISYDEEAGSFQTSVSWAAVVAGVAADFGTAGYSGGPVARYQGAHSAVSGTFSGSAVSTEFALQRTSWVDRFPATIRFVVCTRAYEYPLGGYTSIGFVFDANGTPFVEDTWAVVHSTSQSGAGGTSNIQSSLFGDKDTIPNTTADPTATGSDRLKSSRGWEHLGDKMVVDYDFTYV